MHSLSANVINSLSRFNQRKLQKGEVFLLAKVIADCIPLAPQDTDNIALYTLTHRKFVDEVIYTLNNYTYIDDSCKQLIYKLINEQALWRKDVAYNPPRIFFRGHADSVVDDVSSLLKYSDLTYICAIGDIIDNANWVYGTFCDLACEVQNCLKLQSQPA